MRYLWMAVLTAILVIPGVCTAEFYKYVDKDGVVRFTDDISQIPKDQRQGVDTFKSVEPPPALEGEEGGGTAAEREGTDSQKKVVKSMDAHQQELQQAIQEMDSEYQGLMEEKALLEQELATVRTKPKMRVYNEKVRVLNDKLQDYSERRTELEEQTQAYNERADAINRQIEQPE